MHEWASRNYCRFNHLSIKIKTLDEEKASLEATVCLLDEDTCQLIFKNSNLGYDHERVQSLVEKNGDTNNNQNSLPNSNGPIELIDVENTSQEHNSYSYLVKLEYK